MLQGIHTKLLTGREGVTRHPHQVVDREGRCYKASTHQDVDGGGGGGQGLLQGIQTKVLMKGGGGPVARHPYQVVDKEESCC